MRVFVGVLVALSLVLFGCSATTPAFSRRAARPAPSIPPLAAGMLRSSGATAGISVYVDSAAEVTRGADWQVRLIIVNDGAASRHFGDLGKDVRVTQKGMPDSIGVGDILGLRSARPLDLRPGASSIETLTFDSASTKELTAGYHPVQALVSLEESTSPSRRITLRTAPLGVLFR